MDTRFDKEKVRVGVLMGGLSAERAVSIMSGQGVLGALRERGWNAVEVIIDRNTDKTIRDANIDVAFVALHGKFGEDGCVQGLLEMMGIPYTGSGVQASAIAMDKALCGKMLLYWGLSPENHVSTIRSLILNGKDGVPDPLPFNQKFPVIVKPASSGSSIGVRKANNREELLVAVTAARKFSHTVIVEDFIDGYEITVPVLNGQALPAVGIVPDDKLFNYDNKYVKGTATFEYPANDEHGREKHAKGSAECVYKLLNCRGLARADYIVTHDNLYFLEINTIPGMTPTSLSPMSAASIGMSYCELCEAILQSATCEQEEFPPGT